MPQEGGLVVIDCIRRFTDRFLRNIIRSHLDAQEMMQDTSPSQAGGHKPPLPPLRDFVLAQLFCAAADGSIATVQEIALMCGWLPADDDEWFGCEKKGGTALQKGHSLSWSLSQSCPIPGWLSRYDDNEIASVFAVPTAGTDGVSGSATSFFANEPFQLLHYCAISPAEDVVEFVLSHRAVFEQRLGLRVETSAPSRPMNVARVDILGGITPLHLAAICGSLSAVRVFIAFGANLGAKRDGGLSALDDAALTAVERNLEMQKTSAAKHRVSVCASPSRRSSSSSRVNQSVLAGGRSPSASSLIPCAAAAGGPHFTIAVLLAAKGGESTYVNRIAAKHSSSAETADEKRKNSRKRGDNGAVVLGGHDVGFRSKSGLEATQVRCERKDFRLSPEDSPLPPVAQGRSQSQTSSCLASPLSAGSRGGGFPTLAQSLSSLADPLSDGHSPSDVAGTDRELLLLAGMKSFVDQVMETVRYRIAHNLRTDIAAEKSILTGDEKSRRKVVEQGGHSSFELEIYKCIQKRMRRNHRARLAALGSATDKAEPPQVKVGDYVVVSPGSRYLNSRSLTSHFVQQQLLRTVRLDAVEQANRLGVSVFEGHHGGLGGGFLSINPVKSTRTGWAANIAAAGGDQHPIRGSSLPLNLTRSILSPCASSANSTGTFPAIVSRASTFHDQQHLASPNRQQQLPRHSSLADVQLVVPEASALVTTTDDHLLADGRIEQRSVAEPIRFVELSQNVRAQAGAAVFSKSVLAGNAASIVGEVMFVGILPAGLDSRADEAPLVDGDGEALNDDVTEPTAKPSAVFVGLRVEPRHANCDGTYCFDGKRHFQARLDEIRKKELSGDACSLVGHPNLPPPVDCGLYVPASDVTVISSDCGRRIALHRLARAAADQLRPSALGQHNGCAQEPLDLSRTMEIGGSHSTISLVKVIHPNRSAGLVTPEPHATHHPPIGRSATSMSTPVAVRSHSAEMRALIKRRRMAEQAEVAKIRKKM